MSPTEVPILESFEAAAQGEKFAALPENWWVAVADIVDSTGAIESGRYRAVNLLGAAPIVGILNAVGRAPLPFSFGGDGAVVCVPDEAADTARRVLASVRHIGRASYDLRLRTGVVPMTYLREKGADVTVARVRLSEHVTQPVFRGTGLVRAEDDLKAGRLPEAYVVPADPDAPPADFSGLECRWQEVPSASEETVSILVQAAPGEDGVYAEGLARIREIYGEDPTPHPVSERTLRLTADLRLFWGEAKLRAFGTSRWERLAYVAKAELQTWVGRLLMRLGVDTRETAWSAYKEDLVAHTDYRKLDGMLRLVLAGTAAQREALTAYLDAQHAAGRLAYGLHVTDTALITCMVYQYHKQHIHFVDGNDGGYALAAKDLRERLGELG